MSRVRVKEPRCKHGVWAGDHCYQCAAEPLSPSPEIRYQLRNWHHVTCLVAGGACNCLEQREALIAELALKEKL